MKISNEYFRRLRLFTMLTAATVLFGANEMALAGRSSNSGNHNAIQPDKHSSKNMAGDKFSKRNDKHAEKQQKKNCGIVPSVGCPISHKNPVGSTRPPKNAKPPATTSQKPEPSGPTVTLSTGVTNSKLRETPGGLLVTSTTPGTITVTNANRESVTLKGGSLTLSGAISVGAASNIQMVRTPQGVSVAIKPEAPPPAPPKAAPALGHVISHPGVLSKIGDAIDSAAGHLDPRVHFEGHASDRSK